MEVSPFLKRAAITTTAVALDRWQCRRRGGPEGVWVEARRLFDLDYRHAYFSGLLLCPHPRPVRRAIEEHRRGLDRNPSHYLFSVAGGVDGRERRVTETAGRYFGVAGESVALTTSTTAGLGLLYHGIRIRPDQAILTSEHDYYSTHETLRLKCEATGARLDRVRLYDDPRSATVGEIVERVRQALLPETRVVALTWVHSSTGVKLPLSEIATVVREVNRSRSPDDAALVCVDGVHGLGTDDVTFDGLGCHFLVAGTHKWIWGPRGTGVIFGKPEAWEAVEPAIPSFDVASLERWKGRPDAPDTPRAWRVSPGGYHAFEHRWALADAFELHMQLGKARIAAWIEELATRCKQELSALPHVTVHTPMSRELSAGIVCFDVHGLTPRNVMRRLARARVVIDETPYRQSHARLTPFVFNSHRDVNRLLEAVRRLG